MRLRDHLDKLNVSISKNTDTLIDIEKVLIKQQALLDEHMRRTVLNETRMDRVEKWFFGMLLTAVTGILLAIMKGGL